VSVSPMYDASHQLTLGVLPVIVDGKPDQQSDRSMTDQIAERFLELGFRVIDQSTVNAAAKSLGIDVTKELSTTEMMKLAGQLKLDAFLAGTAQMKFYPASSESRSELIPTTRYEIRNSRDKDGRQRADTIVVHDEVPSVRQSSIGDRYELTAVSLKVLKAENGEVLISGFAEGGGYDKPREIVDAIRMRLTGH
jgi:hypothetical protein